MGTSTTTATSTATTKPTLLYCTGMHTNMINHLSNNASAILRIQALPRSGPFPTLDPFLFAVYHVDDYPADQSGGRMEFVEDHERGNGK